MQQKSLKQHCLPLSSSRTPFSRSQDIKDGLSVASFSRFCIYFDIYALRWNRVGTESLYYIYPCRSLLNNCLTDQLPLSYLTYLKLYSQASVCWILSCQNHRYMVTLWNNRIFLQVLKVRKKRGVLINAMEHALSGTTSAKNSRLYCNSVNKTIRSILSVELPQHAGRIIIHVNNYIKQYIIKIRDDCCRGLLAHCHLEAVLHKRLF